MTKLVANTIIQTDTFAGWLDRTNELATELRNSVITTANSANVQFTGANTSGNGFVVGVFGANTFAMLTNGNSDAFIRAIQSGNTNSANASGNVIFQSVTTHNANFYANNILVDIEGNVVSNGTYVDITTTTNTDITSANALFTISDLFTVDADDFVVTGNTANLTSTTTNVTGDDLFVSANVFVEAANLTFGNGAVSTDTSVETATLSVSANATFSGANAYVNGTQFKVASNTVINGSLADVNANVDIDNALTDINATNLLLGGTTANLNSTTVNITGTTTNVDSNQFNASANVYLTGANVHVNTSITVTGSATIGDAGTDSHTITGNASFVNSVAITQQLAVTANVAVNSTNFFVDTATGRTGVGTNTPDTILHVSGGGTQAVTIEGGTANVLIVANSQSTIFGTQNVVIKAAASKHIKLHANNQTAADKTLMLAANGNVGVGNTSPADKLVVAGTLRVTGNAVLEANLDVQDVSAADISANTLTLTSNADFVDITFEDATGNSVTSNTFTYLSAVDARANNVTLDSNAATEQAVVTFAVNTYHSAKIVVTGRHTNSSVTEVQQTEVLVVTDGTDVFLTTYGTISTDASNDFSVFTLDADVNAGNVRLLANTSHANTKITSLSQLFRIQ